MEHKVDNVMQEGPLFNEDGSDAKDILAEYPEVNDVQDTPPPQVAGSPVKEELVNPTPPAVDDTPPNAV